MSKSTLKSIPTKVAKILTERRKELAAIEASSKYSATYKASQREMAEGQYRHELDMLADAHEYATDSLRQDVARAFQPKGDANALVLEELRGTRAWLRVSRQLDAGTDAMTAINTTLAPFKIAGPDAHQTWPGCSPSLAALGMVSMLRTPEAASRQSSVKNLADAGDRAALVIARQEIPSYLQASGAQKEIIAGTLKYLDRAMEPLLTPDEKKAKELEAEADKLAYYSKAALEHGRHELSGQGTVTVLPTVNGALPVGE